MGKLKHGHIVFVSHNASRSGAPKILLGIIKSFKELFDMEVSVLLVEGGPLLTDFRSLARTFVLYEKPAGKVSSSRVGIVFFRKIYYFLKAKWIIYRLKSGTVFFLNTITNGLIHRKLLKFPASFITYVHEMETSIVAATSSVSLGISLHHSDFFFAGSNAVKMLLHGKYKVPISKIKTVYSSIGIISRNKIDFRDSRKHFFLNQGLNDDAFIVGLIGTNEWRKGFDLLLPLLKIYFSKDENSRAVFVWKGLNPTTDLKPILFDLDRFGLTDRVRLLPHDGEALNVISTFDLHLLLSREDPYPLVVLEAASFSVPTICFANAGGAPEFVGSDAGMVIPYGDLIAVADAIHQMESNSETLEVMGRIANEKLRHSHHADDAAKDLYNCIRLLENNSVSINEKFAPTL